MSNTILTPQAVTREALRILHQKLNFIGTINRQYDESFTNVGAMGKGGDTLKIRLPNKYSVRTGAALATQDTTEESVSLTAGTQKGVDLNFSSTDLTLSLDNFSERILEPAMAVLSSSIEADVMNVYKDVYNEVSGVGDPIAASGDLSNVLFGAQKLTDNLAPASQRALNMNTKDNATLVNQLKGLFNDPAKIAKNYREGMVANQFLGYADVFENTLWPTHQTGSSDNAYLYNAAGGQDGSAGLLSVDTGSGTFKKGDILMIGGVYRVHPETKGNTGYLQQVVVTADYAGGAGNISIAPNLIASGARQTVNAAPVDNVTVRKLESDETTLIPANADYRISMGYHRDAFAFVSADLVMPQGVDFSAREVMDNISMRIVRQYDINNDKFPCRIDVLYGYKCIRPELAVRYGFN